jgi:hypothetical protein
MASVRKLKKNIDYLIFEVISDCFTFGGLHPETEADEVSGIISDAVNLRNDLIKRVNNPERGDNQKVVKTYFHLVKRDLFTGIDNLFGRLSDVSKKK